MAIDHVEPGQLVWADVGPVVPAAVTQIGRYFPYHVQVALYDECTRSWSSFRRWLGRERLTAPSDEDRGKWARRLPSPPSVRKPEAICRYGQGDYVRERYG